MKVSISMNGTKLFWKQRDLNDLESHEIVDRLRDLYEVRFDDLRVLASSGNCNEAIIEP